jgi:hypothetical protein
METESEKVTILRTGKLFAFDMAVDLLKRECIPHFTHEETIGGLKVALPASPSSGPGVCFVIIVPGHYRDKAKEVLSTLPFPITTSPDVWDSTSGQKLLLKWMQFAFLLIFIGSLVSLARNAWFFSNPHMVPLQPGQILNLKSSR